MMPRCHIEYILFKAAMSACELAHRPLEDMSLLQPGIFNSDQTSFPETTGSGLERWDGYLCALVLERLYRSQEPSLHLRHHMNKTSTTAHFRLTISSTQARVEEPPAHVQ
jgi:hypothetical protein